MRFSCRFDSPAECAPEGGPEFLVMLSFATEFPVNPASRAVDFVETVRTWLLNSPHRVFSSDDLVKIPLEGYFNATKEDQKLEFVSHRSEHNDGAAFRHIIESTDFQWSTNIIFSRSATNSWIGIRVYCESKLPSVRLPDAKKPIIVKLLLNELGDGHDGSLTVLPSPHKLLDTELELATDLMNGTASCRLPVVYASKNFNDGYEVDTDALANDLSGMAHVVLEPNINFSRRLRYETSSDNVYGGVVGIYWPEGAERKRFFLPNRFDSSWALKKAVCDDVRRALVNRRPMPRCTWSFIQETAARIAYESLKTSGSNEIGEYIEVVDAELKAKDERLNEAEREITRLKGEVSRYESRRGSGSSHLFNLGDEQDYYPEEVKQVTLEAIEDALSRHGPDSRRFHILQSVHASNAKNLPEIPVVALKEELKRILRGYREMDSQTKRDLEKLGFTILSTGKHHKLTYQGDERYTFILAKSGSDHRGGLNAASDISKRIY